MVEALKKAIKKAADIHSPSKLFKKEIGVQISAGVAEGITDEGKNVNRAGISMISELVKKSKTEMQKQQNELESYASEVTNSTGLIGLSNLIKMQPIQQTVNMDNSTIMQIMNQMLTLMQEISTQSTDTQLVLDTGELVGGTSTTMGNALAMMTRRIR